MAPPGETEEIRDEIANLVNEKIEDLRPRLLDLTARNPLIRVRLSHNSNSYMRVVDELPDVLFFRLSEGKSMKFSALPPIEDEPPDEQSEAFRDAVAAARVTDEPYRVASEALDPNAADYLDHSRKLERTLKDRIREEIGLPPRPTGKDISSLSAHAKSHGITPAYDLPDPVDESEDGRHTDDEIQTLQLPRDLERRLNAIISKGRTWQQETGINVVQAAFGFLEWSDPKAQDNNLSPLVVLPVLIKAKKSPRGTQFAVFGAGDIAESNGVLTERLKRDIGLDLPLYNGGSIEDYFKQIDGLRPDVPTWRVRRQVVFGIFPSARIAMYHDLDTSTADFASSGIVRAIMVGTDPSGVSPFADDYDIDATDERGATPLTVRDADSSQVSTMLDVAANKNVAVEGPPGTGKSQTIVNVVAAALADGKKVLFVAEKLAALDVVRSRLEAVGLGDFTLALQAGRSSREEVALSLRNRLALVSAREARDYESVHRRLRETRSRLGGYIKILSSSLPKTDFTVHQILGRAIATGSCLEGLPSHIRDTSLLPNLVYDETTIHSVRASAQELDTARKAAAQLPDHWSGINRPLLTAIEVEELLELTETAVSQVAALLEAAEECRALGVQRHFPTDKLATAVSALGAFLSSVPETDIRRWARLLNNEKIGQLKQISKAIRQVAVLRERLSLALNDPEGDANRVSIERALAICQKAGLQNPDPIRLKQETEKLRHALQSISQVGFRLSEFERHHPPASSWTLSIYHDARALVSEFPREILELRSRSSADAATDGAMSALIAKGQALAAKKQELSSHFLFDASVTGDSLRRTLSIIKNSGALSIFSSDMRAARRLYLSLSRKNAFDRDTAVSELMVLAELVERETEFLSDSNCRTLFGLHFQGLDTDFDRFGKLRSYYENVDTAFPGPDHREVRDFLKTAETDLLHALPDTGGLAEQLTVAELERAVSQQQSKLDEATQDCSELESSVVVLRDPATATVQNLEGMLDDIEAVERLSAAMEFDQVELGIVEDVGSKSDFDPTKLRLWVDFLERMIDCDCDELVVALQSSAIAGGLTDLSSVLERLLDSSQAAEKMFLNISERSGIGLESPVADPAASLSWLEAAKDDRTGLLAHLRVARAKQVVEDTGFGKVAEQLIEHRSDLENIAEIVDALIARYSARQIYQHHGRVLEGYTGEALFELRSRFSELDKKLIELSRDKLVAGLVETANPPPGCGIGRKADYTEMALIWNETEKKRKHIPVRDLLNRAGRAVLELKPCWMMSPQAVAQYIPKDSLQFDLCIIDEASQMPPEDAIGALYRSRQTMIVGDTEQLPPTSFFRKLLDDDSDDNAETETVLEESVLEMAKATFRPARRLRWHYRSKHSDLIRFCNRLIYRDDLIVFPSAEENRPNMGVRYQRVDGRYKSGLNTDEARIVVDAIVRFMDEYPDRSLVLLSQEFTQDFQLLAPARNIDDSAADIFQCQRTGDV